MTALRWTVKTCTRVFVGAAVAVALTGSAMAQNAEESNPLENAPDVQLLRSIMSGLGLKRGDEPSIDYRERSPLVVPPDMTLPPPQTKSLAERTPNWPLDQDIKRARAYAAAQRKHDPHYDDIAEGRVLRPGEMTPGPRGNQPDVIGQTTTPEEGAKVLSPSALGYVGNLFSNLLGDEKSESKPFTGEPARTALTDPPPGYQTPSPSQPYGAGKSTFQPKAFDPMDQPARGDGF